MPDVRMPFAASQKQTLVHLSLTASFRLLKWVSEGHNGGKVQKGRFRHPRMDSRRYRRADADAATSLIAFSTCGRSVT